jgi:AmiR/NasT family two-component response regulator
LAQFCERIADDAGPVVALLDFPRHDRVERARQLGATAVLGMPWREFDLLDALGLVTMPASPTIDVPARRDAA